MKLVVARVLDLFIAPFLCPAALLMKSVRAIGVQRLPVCRRALLRLGVFPIRDHYSEPFFNFGAQAARRDEARSLPGLDWNVAEQLALLDRFRFSHELREIDVDVSGDHAFCLRNRTFEGGDVEFFYNMLRVQKPRRLVEVGSGHSTRVAVLAIAKNREEDPGYSCDHVCIEPFRAPWLESLGVRVLRQRLEDCDRALFASLAANDILFIDSSHVIRPGGDVLVEYLEILPTLQSGVIVHSHDIFSPRDYPARWLREDVRFWNEQYLLEALLTDSDAWRIIGAVNYLHHNHRIRLRDKCIFLTDDTEPGSFYIQRR